MPGGGQKDGSHPLLPAPLSHLCKARIWAPAAMCNHALDVFRGTGVVDVFVHLLQSQPNARVNCLVLGITCAVQGAAEGCSPSPAQGTPSKGAAGWVCFTVVRQSNVC